LFVTFDGAPGGGEGSPGTVHIALNQCESLSGVGADFYDLKIDTPKLAPLDRIDRKSNGVVSFSKKCRTHNFTKGLTFDLGI